MRFLLLGCLLCAAFSQDAKVDPLTTRAIEGATVLKNHLRDPGSLKLAKVWIMHSEKHGDAVCFNYRASNGFGGINYSAADYAPNHKGEYILNPADANWDGPKGDMNAPFPGGYEYFSRCGERAQKHDRMVKEVTEEVSKALTLDR